MKKHPSMCQLLNGGLITKKNARDAYSEAMNIMHSNFSLSEV